MSAVKSKWDKQDHITTENVYGDIITKPNQSSSVRDILFRNTQGMTYDNYKTPYYEDQATFSSVALNKIQEMEPAEKMAFLAEHKKKVESLNKKIKDFEDQKAAAEAAAAAKKAAQAAAAAEPQTKE